MIKEILTLDIFFKIIYIIILKILATMSTIIWILDLIKTKYILSN